MVPRLLGRCRLPGSSEARNSWQPYRRGGKLDLQVTTLVNDTVIGSGSTAQLDRTFGEVVSYAARGAALVPGDIIGSGRTCTLVEHRNPAALESSPGWRHDGGVVTLRVEGLGATPTPARINPSARAPSTRGAARGR